MKAKLCKGNVNLPYTDILRFIALHRCDQQKDYDLLYGNTWFIVVVPEHLWGMSVLINFLMKITKGGLDSVWLNPDIYKYDFVDILFCLHKFIYLKWDNGGEGSKVWLNKLFSVLVLSLFYVLDFLIFP